MAPKKKTGKGKGKGKGGGLGSVIDGVDISQMTREQLEVFVRRIRDENEREREERNYFQIERDRLCNFWEITRSELEELRAKLRKKDREIEEENEKNEEDIKLYKHKVKHLQYEHQNDLTESKAESMVALKLAQDEHIAQERELLKDKAELKKQLREQETSHQDKIKYLKLEHSEKTNKIRKEFERKTKEIELKYDKKLCQLQRELETKHRMEMSELEERKNSQISDLTRNHERSFNEMKNYYNDITLNNLALISSLKDEMVLLKQEHEKMTLQISSLSTEKRKMVEPMRKAQEEVLEYKKQLENYKQDKLSLANIKTKLYDTKKELDELRWANEALEVRFENLQSERDELHKKFVKAILEVQQKTNLQNALLQKKIQQLNDAAEYREVVIGELTAAADVPPQHINRKLEETLDNKNMMIKDLQYELARVCKAHDDLLKLAEEKFEKYGIPRNELGSATLRILPYNPKKGSAKNLAIKSC